MTFLVTLRQATKAFGERALFSELTLHIVEGDRLGLIGPNGSGKSTLLGLLGGKSSPDEGERLAPRPMRTGWVEQSPAYGLEATLEELLVERLAEVAADPREAPILGEDEASWPVRASVTLGRLGFPDPQAKVGTLSGGWHRRLAIARAIVNDPDLLLLDEPTNHLDLESILWLEKLLRGLRSALVVISHDRAFLQAVARRVLEVDPRYPGGTFLVEGPYSEFLGRREQFLEAESERRASLANKVAREVEWLSRGPKARGTKAKGRIDEAERLKAELAEMKLRAREGSAQIDFSASGRQTRRLLVAEGLGCQRGGRWLFRRLNLLLRPGMRLGLVGPNGSGKTSLLQVLSGERRAEEGKLRLAPNLETVVFDQRREALDPSVTLRRALAPEGG
ncbi:MAG: ATP-binding cassette domain-containing protein, partial [Polyangia bacterium]|nr:ATP-binding cassette domain-containing protein [Polyangia bacterium]